MKKYIVVFLFTVSIYAFAQKSGPIITVPRIHPIITDGTIKDHEWNKAKRIVLADGSAILMGHDDEFLYVGFKGLFEPWGHFYIKNRSDVYVFHPTIGMGKVIYKIDRADIWQPDRRFNWKLKKENVNTANSSESEKFLKEEGWIPYYNTQPGKKELIYKINIKRYDKKNFFVAIVYGFRSPNYLFWPSTLDDASIKPEIFTGYNPADIKFDFKSWAKLQFSD